MKYAYFVCLPDETLSIYEANDLFYDTLGIKEIDIKKNPSFLRFINNPSAFLNELTAKKEWATYNIEVDFMLHTEKHTLVLFGSFKYDKFFFYGILKENISNNLEYKLLEKEYKTLQNQSRDVVFEYDIKNDTMYYPSNNKTLFATKPVVQNYKKYLVSSKSPIHKTDRQRVMDYFDHIGNEESSFIDTRINTSGLEERSVRIKTSVVFDDDVAVKGIGMIYSTEDEKKVYNEITEKSQHDFLTGVLNLDSIKSLISLELREKTSPNNFYALMLIDIDNFNAINQKYGIDFADDILINAAKKIADYFGRTALVGRSRPNQFVVFIGTEPDYSILRTKTIQVCKLFRSYIFDADTRDHITVSIGLSRYPYDGKTADDLIEKADMALYMAKNNGKDCSFLYVNDNLSNMKRYSETKIVTDLDKLASETVFNYITQTSDITKNLVETFNQLLTLFKAYGICLIERDGLKAKATVSAGLFKSSFMNEFNECLEFIGNGFVRRFNTSGYYILNDETALGEIEKELYRKNEIKSGAIIALEKNHHYDVSMAILFNENHEFTTFELETYKHVIEIIQLYIYKFRLNDSLMDSIKKIDQEKETKRTYAYLVDKTNFELLDFDSKTVLTFPEAKRHSICYKALMGRDIPCDKCPILEFRKTRINTTDYYLQEKKIWVSSTVADFEMPNGNKAYLIYSTDVSMIMRRMTSRDSLTGLLTISSFVEKASELVSSRSINKYAIVYFDIDKFKLLNELLGYSTGDKILLYVTKVISNIISESELLFRVSGDQFVLLLKYEDTKNLLSRLESIRERLGKAKFDGHYRLELSITGGINLLDARTSISMNQIDLANVARKVAKESLHDNFVIYDENIDLAELKKKEIEKIMDKALADQEFIVYIHPKVNIETGRICGGEALIRWFHNGYLVPPGEFIPVFEENGFVLNIDHYVYETIFKLVKMWQDNHMFAVTISMNASALHFRDPNFIPILKGLVDKYQVETRYIEIELTESLAIDCSQNFRNIINELKGLGFTLSLDDFGSGYSSLNILSSLPVDVMKLDKGFFDSKNEKGRVVVESVVNLANSLGIKPLAEGIETEEQVEFLHKVGCHYVQGYYYYKPMPLNDFIELLKKDSEKNDLE